MEKRFIFSDLSEAKAVLGMKDEFLKTIQKEFPDCRIASRGDEVIIVGGEPGVSQVETVLRTLRYLYRENTYMTTQHVRYSSSLIKQGKEDLLQSIYGDTVSISARGRLIKPKTAGQKQYVDSIRKNLVTFGIGPAGTGKTYLAVALASYYLKNREVERIILTRPAVEAGEKLGFLPGDLQEKIDPYLRPLYDALADMFGYDQFQKMVTRNIIEVAPLAYMRGRTLEESFIILDEAQNTTKEQMKMFLTRMGNHSRVVVNGDVTQIDLVDRKMSGLIEAQKVLQNVRGLGMVYFTDEDVVRHDMVGRIIRAYEDFYKKE
ncbi:PhoH family protein [Megasphaera butyrica]|jgi:phosphate starvation-inducible PhoH-like protein|uniref:PhoH-like protein n=2 Tax=Megasphaera TaxID=906 RepID=A0A346B1Z7_9FIRM|nr:PhoH family protein [Megasphaera stantonii]NJE34508.1 PhoH family protein [Megasphaera sp. SW808]OUO47398.1 phosphate starvation-inducible protein PhoH [Megasphaera sp. An286]SCH68633.1 PhoH-like protein [uncultured Megasphaera sp.]SCJ16626.1 PhoH-like protein [uncultured Ruminococcus sp.]